MIAVNAEDASVPLFLLEDGKMSSSEEVSWISWFCGLRGNEFFCEVSWEALSTKCVCGHFHWGLEIRNVPF